MMADPATLTPQGVLPFYQEGFDSRRFESLVLDVLNTGIELPVEVGGKMIFRKVIGAQKRGKEGVAQGGIDILADLGGGKFWGFECKHHKNWDLGKTKTAVQKAEEGFPGAERYVLVLACEVTKEVQDHILDLPKWDLWTASRLTSLLRVRAPREGAHGIVASNFGGNVALQMFPLHDDLLLSGDAYYAKYLKGNRLFHHQAGLVGREVPLEDLEKFCESGEKRVFFIKARGGEGKSRLLLELSRRVGRGDSGRTVLFVNPNSGGSPASVSLGGISFERTVVVQDDAHRIENLRPEIVTQIAENEGAKLIVATRPQVVEALREQLFQAGIDSTQVESRELGLPRLTDSEMARLAQEILGPDDQSEATRLAEWSERSPLICVIGGGLIRRGSMRLSEIASSREFRDEVFRRFEDENLKAGACPAHIRDDAGQLLRLVALVAPVFEDDLLFANLEKVFSWRPERSEELLTHLKSAELLLSTRDGLRVDPDLLADHLTYSASLKQGERTQFVRRVVEVLGGDYWATMLRNLSEAEWRGERDDESGRRVDITGPLWESYLHEFLENPRFRGNLLNIWSRFAVFQPERSIELADTVLSDLGSDRHLIAELVPVLASLTEWSPSHRIEALERLWKVSARLPEGGGSSGGRDAVWEKIAALLKVGPGWSEARALEVLDWLDSLFDRPENAWLRGRHHEFLNLVLGNAFSRSGERVVGSGDRRMQLARYRLRPAATRTLRQRAIELIRGRLLCDSPIACGNAVDALREGMKRIVTPFDERGDKTATREERQRQRERKEWRSSRAEALAVLKEMLEAHRDPFLQFRIHRILLHFLVFEEDEKYLTSVEAVHKRIEGSFEFELCRVLLGDVDDEFGEDRRAALVAEVPPASGTYRRGLDKLRSSARSQVAHVLAECPENVALEAWMADFNRRAAAHGFSSLNWNHLMRALALENPARAEGLLIELFEGRYEALGRWINALVGSFPNTRQQEWIMKMLDSGRDDVFASALHHLRWSSMGDFPGTVWQKIMELARSGSPARQGQLAEFAAGYFYSDAGFSLELLATLPASAIGTESLEEIAGCIAHLYGEELKIIPEVVWERLCKALLDIPDLDSPQVEFFLVRLNQHRPRLAYELYRGRIERHEEIAPDDGEWEAGDWLGDGAQYQPLPFLRFATWGINLEGETDFDEIAVELLEKALADDSFAGYWRDLFWVAVVKTSESGPGLIASQLDKISSAEELLKLIGLFAKDGSLFVFRQPEFVRNALLAASKFPPEDGRRIRSCLVNSAGPALRSITDNGGELKEDLGGVLEEAERAKILHLDDPLLSQFYDDIIAIEGRDREDFRRWFDEGED